MLWLIGLAIPTKSLWEKYNCFILPDNEMGCFHMHVRIALLLRFITLEWEIKFFQKYSKKYNVYFRNTREMYNSRKCKLKTVELLYLKETWFCIRIYSRQFIFKINVSWILFHFYLEIRTFLIGINKWYNNTFFWQILKWKLHIYFKKHRIKLSYYISILFPGNWPVAN